MDVEALYPSIEISRSAEIVGEIVRESSVKIENVDFETATRFIASNASQAQINDWGMGRYIPRRRHKTGVRPGATTKELGKRRKYTREGEEIESTSKWVVSRREMSLEEKNRVVAKVIELGIRTTFRNHLYQWGGQTHVQREGGPIGLKLTGVVAKMRMIRWMKKFNSLTQVNNIRTYLNIIFVDDHSWAGRALRRGVRWDPEGKNMKWEKK